MGWPASSAAAGAATAAPGSLEPPRATERSGPHGLGPADHLTGQSSPRAQEPHTRGQHSCLEGVLESDGPRPEVPGDLPPARVSWLESTTIPPEAGSRRGIPPSGGPLHGVSMRFNGLDRCSMLPEGTLVVALDPCSSAPAPPCVALKPSHHAASPARPGWSGIPGGSEDLPPCPWRDADRPLELHCGILGGIDGSLDAPLTHWVASS